MNTPQENKNPATLCARFVQDQNKQTTKRKSCRFVHLQVRDSVEAGDDQCCPSLSEQLIEIESSQ